MSLKSGFKAVAATLLLLSAVASASAQSRAEIKKTLEASLLVTGEINISPDGSVERYTLDQPEKLQKEVIGLIDNALPRWVFEPIVRDGKAVAARSRMSLRLVANKRDDGDYQMAIRGATFTGNRDQEASSAWLKQQHMDAPRYPEVAAQAGVGGTVYVVVRIARDGHVADAFAEQTNLRVLGNARDMERWRKIFERASLSAVNRWKFTTPENGNAEADGSWTIRVPIAYEMTTGGTAYGTWSPYIPGPRALAPWVKPEFARAQDIDAGQGGLPAPVGTGVRLKTDLSQG